MAWLQLLTGAVLYLATGAVYWYVGRRIAARSVEPRQRVGVLVFAAWWFAAAALSILNGMTNLLAGLGALDPDFFVAATYFS